MSLTPQHDPADGTTEVVDTTATSVAPSSTRDVEDAEAWTDDPAREDASPVEHD